MLVRRCVGDLAWHGLIYGAYVIGFVLSRLFTRMRLGPCIHDSLKPFASIHLTIHPGLFRRLSRLYPEVPMVVCARRTDRGYIYRGLARLDNACVMTTRQQRTECSNEPSCTFSARPLLGEDPRRSTAG